MQLFSFLFGCAVNALRIRPFLSVKRSIHHKGIIYTISIVTEVSRDTSSPFAGQFYQGTVEKVTERWCTVKYDDGDVFSDYFDLLPGSQIFRKLES